MYTRTAQCTSHSEQGKIINLAATNLIACLNCSALVPVEQIQSHSRTHLPQIYNKPITKPSKLQKIDLSAIIGEESTQPANVEEFAVQSVLPGELPQAEQKKKKNAQKPNGQVLGFNDDSGAVETPRSIVEEQSLVEDISMILEEGKQNLENMEQLILMKKIQPRKSKITVNKDRYIKLYQNSQEPHPQVDSIIQEAKPKINHTTDNAENKDSYDMVVMDRKKQQPFTVQVSNTHKPALRRKIDFNMDFSQCFSKPGLDQSQTADTFFTKPSNIDFLSKPSNIERSQLECLGCSGFYCNTCGSDIPPQFRPTNNVQSRQLDIYWQQVKKYRRMNRESEEKTPCNGCK